MIYTARLYWLINCLNGREWLWPVGHGSTGYLVYGPWPTSELSRLGKPACFRRWPVCLSVSLSLSLYIYIYIFIFLLYCIFIFILYCMQNLGNVDFIHTGL